MDSAILSPFSPQYPIEPRMFVGRSKELSRLEAALAHAKARRPFNFMVLGERGIGKTSLIDFIAQLARSYGEIQNETFNYIVVHIILDDYTTHLDFFKKFELAVRREIEKSEQAKTYLDNVWSFLQRLELGINVAGVKVGYKVTGRSPEQQLMWEEFARSVLDIVERTCRLGDPGSLFDSTAYDGMLILIDEVDKAPNTLNLGSLLKYLTEYLMRNNCRQVMIGLSGLPSAVDVILDSHKSALRIFEEIRLDRLKDKEVRELLSKCQLEADTQVEDLDPQLKLERVEIFCVNDIIQQNNKIDYKKE